MRLGPGPEFDLIRGFVPDGVAGPGVRVGPGDDCAVVEANGVALSTDMSIEGVHFRRDWLSAEQIGWRAAAAALSDLAAMAARPVGVLVSLALPASDAGDFATRLMSGVRAAAGHLGGVILGGDVARTTGPVAVDVVVVGECPHPVLRSGGEPEDSLWVTGELGAPAAAVSAWLRGDTPPAPALDRFARPIPRTREAAWLTERGLPRAMLDLSDGLGGDVAHLAAASGLAAVLELSAVPVHPAASLEEALGGGEDFELCFAARPGSVEPHVAAFEEHFGLRLSRVGRLEPGSGVSAEGPDGNRSAVGGGFQHFAVA